jgi:hypothetical protein
MVAVRMMDDDDQFSHCRRSIGNNDAEHSKCGK